MLQLYYCDIVYLAGVQLELLRAIVELHNFLLFSALKVLLRDMNLRNFKVLHFTHNCKTILALLARELERISREVTLASAVLGDAGKVVSASDQKLAKSGLFTRKNRSCARVIFAAQYSDKPKRHFAGRISHQFKLIVFDKQLINLNWPIDPSHKDFFRNIIKCAVDAKPKK